MRYDSPQPGATERVNGHHVGYSFDQSPERRTHLLHFAARPVAQWREEAGGKGGGGGITFLATDHLGTPACALAGDGSVTWSGGFEPFGRDWQHGTPEGALASGLFLRLPGQWDHPYWHRDLRSGGFGADLFYNVHRWYEAGTGRYVSSDPLGLEADINLYGFVGQRPLFYTDPLGLANDDGCPCGSDCPGGRWDAAVASGSVFLGVGGWTRGTAAYTCQSNGLRVDTTFRCITVGLIAGVGGGVEGSIGGPGACGCFIDELYGPQEQWTWAAVVAQGSDSGRCSRGSDPDRKVQTVGVNISTAWPFLRLTGGAGKTVCFHKPQFVIRPNAPRWW
ncbi:MAG: RHS repeat-associated core domain-containing protein [Thermoanaerobaculia bacterium]|nr:RHS repeat-associated core domain-containing protein [Thermoanaerobaculia bacterium]